MNLSDNLYDVKRDAEGKLTEICPIMLTCMVGSIECTKDCKHNQNTKKEIEHYGFDLPKVRCEAITNIKPKTLF